MMKVTHSTEWSRPIMIIEDDMDDQELLQLAFTALDYPTPVIYFSNGIDALEYLHKTGTPPILIISDINMPKINGFEIRKRINQSPELRKFDIPFVFLSTSSQEWSAADAYCATNHVFFTKPYNLAGMRNIIKTIVEYWVQRYTPSLERPERARYNIP